jgi:hypothetical protein
LIALGVALFIQNTQMMGASAEQISRGEVREKARSSPQSKKAARTPTTTPARKLLATEAWNEFIKLSDGEREALKQIYLNGSMMEREVKDFMKARGFVAYEMAYQPIELRTVLVKKSFVGRLSINPQFKEVLGDLLLGGAD